MPELPDVEGFRRVLDKAAVHRIERVDVLDSGALRGVTADELRDALTAQTFATPKRHGKWLVGPVHSGPRHRPAEPSVVFLLKRSSRVGRVPGVGHLAHRPPRRT